MKKHILFILTILSFVSPSFAQKEKVIYKTIADSFEANYNADNFEPIFATFSIEMQTALPIEKTKEFLSSLKLQAGKITKRDFIKYENTYASYKTIFERALFALNISVDGRVVNLEYIFDILKIRVSPKRSSELTTEKSTIDCSP